MVKLREAGYEVMEPASGDLACGTEGKGRLPSIEEIVERIEDIFTAKDLTSERIMVTAGPTTEYIDPVRCITNRSSGKMGYAVAKMARRRGAEGYDRHRADIDTHSARRYHGGSRCDGVRNAGCGNGVLQGLHSHN